MIRRGLREIPLSKRSSCKFSGDTDTDSTDEEVHEDACHPEEQNDRWYVSLSTNGNLIVISLCGGAG